MSAIAETATRERPAPAGPSAATRNTDPAHWAVRLVLAAGAVAVVGVWWADTTASSLRDFGARVTAAGRVAGLLGAYLVLVQLLLMARLPWFERAVGLDRLAAWHRRLGTDVVLLIVTHVLLVIWGYGLTVHHQPVSELWTVITTYPDMLKATAAFLIFVTIGLVSARFARRRLSYETWYAIHLGAYVAVALAFFHQTATGSDFVGHPANTALWITFYVAVGAAILGWRVARPLVLAARHRMYVERVVPEAPGVVSLWIAGRDLERLGARAGQFFLWRFLDARHAATAHPYSLSAPVSPGRLRVTVKAAGDHTGLLAGLRPGTRVLAEGPFGHFTADASTRPKALLVAGGSGIAPIRALAEELSGRGRDVVVIYRVHAPDDLALGRELTALHQAGRIRVHWVTGGRTQLGGDPLAAGPLLAGVPDVREREVYVCGPPGMTAALRTALLGLGLGAGQIHSEEYSLR